MTIDIEQLLALLPPVFARSPERLALAVPGTAASAWAFRIAGGELRGAWAAAAALHGRTGLWPVAVACRDKGGLAREDIFSRNYFREETRRGDVAPEAILRRAAALDVDKFLARRAALAQEDYDLDEAIDNELDAMRFALKKAPRQADVMAAIRTRRIRGPHELDHWLLDWELAAKLRRNPAEGRHEPLAPQAAHLVLLPVANSWDALAYIHWFGCIHYNSEELVALGRTWQQRYGAEVFAIYGETLECLVARPPTSLEAAWSLAREHDLVAPSANAASGTPVRQYAASLVNHDHWSFRERP